MLSNDEVFKLREDWYRRAREQTVEELPQFMAELAQFKHDYNTICYACAAAAVAACWCIDRTPSGGITGFQAGAIMWEFMGAWNGVESPAWLLKAEDLLYPQYSYKFETISKDTWIWLQKSAREKLEKHGEGGAHPDVLAHWRSIAEEGQVPFGLFVRDYSI